MGRITWPTKPADRCRVRPLKDPVNKCKPVPMPQYKMMIDKQRNSPEKLMPPSAVGSWKSSGASAITALPHFSLLFDESRRE